jgi:branched-chain amino acid transport system ATP-binding protein
VKALLACRGLTVRFGGLTALDGLDLHVNEGEVLGLIGPNGSGKTTFFNAVTGIYASAAGQVTFAGKPLTRASPQAVYRAGIARTFQRSRLCLTLSVFDNIMVGAHGRLNHGLAFNLFRRHALAAEVERRFAEAQELVRTFDARLADDRSPPHRDLPRAHQSPQAVAARRAFCRDDARGDTSSDE